jgi:hypothetical protein
MAARPRSTSPFRPILRSGGAVQLGVAAEAGGILLRGLSSGEVALLQRLDETLDGPGVQAAARVCGVPPRRAAELLDLLRDHDLLGGRDLRPDRRAAVPVHGPRPARTVDGSADAGRFVVVDGAGPLAASVAGLLRADGVERVQSGVWAADAADAELRLTGSGAPDLVILVADGALDARAGEPWRRRAVAHLPVVADGIRVVVGPLVTGDPAQPCLYCLRLTRSQLDTEWPAVEAQSRGATVWCDEPLLAMGAGMAAMLARAVVAPGETPTKVPVGVSVEARPPWPRVDHRRWERHTDCPHHGGRDAHAGRDGR